MAADDRKNQEPADQEDIDRFRRFQDVLEAERKIIDKRRILRGREPIHPPPLEENAATGRPIRPVYDTAGVALSGGGIRSAAFCLGVLQSLGAHELFGNIDYLSTVSGGGYIGSSVSACMSGKPPDGKPVNDFPFAAPLEYDDEPSVGHLRDYSNYLLPRGHDSFFEAVAVLLRGWATNLIFILAATLFLAGFTVLAYPSQQTLCGGSYLPQLFRGLFSAPLAADSCTISFATMAGLSGPFTFTLWIALVLAVFLVLWAIVRSLVPAWDNDVRGWGVRIGRWFVLALIFSAVLDMQPLVLHLLFAAGGLSPLVREISTWLAAVTASLTGVVTFFSDKLAGFLKTSETKSGPGALIQRVTALGAIWLAALVLPVLLWLFYIWVCAAGVSTIDAASLPAMLNSWIGEYAMRATHPFAPSFVASSLLVGPDVHLAVAWSYFAAWFGLWVITLFFAPNANSLHQLYRDKLSKAFLFDPLWRYVQSSHRSLRQPDSGDLVPRDGLKLSAISPDHGGPYHLINAALNLQGSIAGNRRGRNADFFLFSSQRVGCDVTGYCDTAKLQNKERHIDLAAAMAISGAAVSSDMGSSSIAPLAPTLALLNVRLGYWMKNPRYLEKGMRPLKRITSVLSGLFKTYLLSEMFGLLDETNPRVYLTDGGHIENLGLYSLLNRHCRLIIVVDAEADPAMTFPALSTVQRYARIDLGIRIDLPWQKIAEVSLAATAAAEAGDPIPVKKGPHCAAGLIHYPDGKDGVLLYVKSSVTGDEADYVLNYKQRNPSFPHESTGDQFFTEEQFECYRALGFHAIEGVIGAHGTGGGQEFVWNPNGPWGQSATANDVRAWFIEALTGPKKT